jgi:hypothetical protein
VILGLAAITSRRGKSSAITNVNNDECVRGDKQKAAGKKERAWACRNRRKQGKKAAREKENRVECRKKT